MLKSTPMTSKNRSRPSLFELNQDTPEIHPWYKFGANVTNICRVIMFTNTNCKFSCWNRHPWPRKIGQGHPSSNLTKTLLRYILVYKFGHNATNICLVIVFTSENCWFHVEIDPMTAKNRSRSSIFELNQDTPEINPWYKFGANVTNICRVIMFTNTNSKFSCWNRHPWPRKIGQGHPSSNLTKTLLRYIHGISLEPMWLIFVELSCLQIQIANFHVEIDTHDLEK